MFDLFNLLWQRAKTMASTSFFSKWFESSSPEVKSDALGSGSAKPESRAKGGPYDPSPGGALAGSESESLYDAYSNSYDGSPRAALAESESRAKGGPYDPSPGGALDIQEKVNRGSYQELTQRSKQSTGESKQNL
jgi:hypothetical protein